VRVFIPRVLRLYRQLLLLRQWHRAAVFEALTVAPAAEAVVVEEQVFSKDKSIKFGYFLHPALSVHSTISIVRFSNHRSNKQKLSD